MKFKLEYIMEVDDFELLELVNDYQERCEVPTFNTLDDIPEALMIEATKTWLKDHYIPYDDIFFRPYKDYSKGAPTKEKIYKEKIESNYNVWFVLDDNYKCVQMYRDLGLTVLQPNEGKF